MKRAPYTGLQSWRWPAVIAAATVLALVSALFEDDGWLDVACALVLAAEVLLCAWFALGVPLARRWRR